MPLAASLASSWASRAFKSTEGPFISLIGDIVFLPAIWTLLPLSTSGCSVGGGSDDSSVGGGNVVLVSGVSGITGAVLKLSSTFVSGTSTGSEGALGVSWVVSVGKTAGVSGSTCASG